MKHETRVERTWLGATITNLLTSWQGRYMELAWLGTYLRLRIIVYGDQSRASIIFSTGKHQWVRWGLDPFITLTALEEAEIIPGEHSDTRIKPLALTNGHGRYITVTPERALSSVGECP
jgi:hypothetical protein